MLIFFGAGTVVATEGSILAAALAHGLTVMVVAYAFGRVSGAHINPTVTVVLAATGRFPWREVPGYVLVQLVGGTIGAFAILASHGTAAVDAGMGSTELTAGVGWLGGLTAEALGAFILLLAIHALAVDARAPGQVAGLGIGLALMVAIVTVGPLTGASLNAARTLGPFIVKTVYGAPTPWDQLPLYVLGPILGGLGAALLYNALVQPPATPAADEVEAQGEGRVIGRDPQAARRQAGGNGRGSR